jgi:hypothetical protein
MQMILIKKCFCLWWEVFVAYFADDEEVETEVRRWLR